MFPGLLSPFPGSDSYHAIENHHRATPFAVRGVSPQRGSFVAGFGRISFLPNGPEVSFAPHKRHLALSALANLLQSLLTEHFGPKAS
jgi:hypothetical protein